MKLAVGPRLPTAMTFDVVAVAPLLSVTRWLIVWLPGVAYDAVAVLPVFS